MTKEELEQDYQIEVVQEVGLEQAKERGFLSKYKDTYFVMLFSDKDLMQEGYEAMQTHNEEVCYECNALQEDVFSYEICEDTYKELISLGFLFVED